MALVKPLEEYSSAELDDLLKLMGVRQHILSRGHVDGYRLVRLTNAQLTGFPFTPMERWKLQMIRRAYTVFKIFTRGLGSGGSCPVNVIARMLRQSFKYDALVVEEVKQGLLSHTVGMRAASGERVVTFDQWAQLFHWIGSRLDIHDTDKLQQRMGAHIGCKELDEYRAPLQAVNQTDNDTPCMPLHEAASAGPSFNLMSELFEAITRSTTSSQSSDTCSLQEEASLNSHDEPPMTSALTPQLRPRTVATPPPVQVAPLTSWASTQSTTPVPMRVLAGGEAAGTSAASPAQPLPATGGHIRRTPSPLSSQYPLHTPVSTPESSATALRDRSQDYRVDRSMGSHRVGSTRTRERSRSPDRSQQLRISGAFSALGRLVQNPAHPTMRAGLPQRDALHPQHRLPVLLSLVQSRGLPAGTRLTEGLAGALDDSAAVPLSSAT